MAQPSDSKVRLSLFDRLTDEEPRISSEVPRHEWDQMAAYKKSVARDLSHLLNTRISENDFPEEYPQARHSVVAFGVHDYTRSPAEQDEIRKSLERAIRIFEPRLTRVQVHFVGGSHMDLHFRISATLKADLGSEPVLFDAELPKTTRRFQVNEGR